VALFFVIAVVADSSIVEVVIKSCSG